MVPGEKPDPDQVFRLSALQNSSVALPPPHVSPAQNPSHRLDTALMETPQDTLVHNTDPPVHQTLNCIEIIPTIIIILLTISNRITMSNHIPVDNRAVILQELNRLNLESSNGKLTSDVSVSYIDSSLISPDTGSLLGNTIASAGSLLSKQNKPKTGRSLLGGPAALSPLTPR